MDSLVRVRAFLDAYPVTGTLSAASAREMLDDVVQRLRAYAGAQHSGRDMSRMELRRQEDQTALLLDKYIRPIVTIARAQQTPGGGGAAGRRVVPFGLCRQCREGPCRSGRAAAIRGCRVQVQGVAVFGTGLRIGPRPIGRAVKVLARQVCPVHVGLTESPF